jgi:hypothetical protein
LIQESSDCLSDELGITGKDASAKTTGIISSKNKSSEKKAGLFTLGAGPVFVLVFDGEIDGDIDFELDDEIDGDIDGDIDGELYVAFDTITDVEITVVTFAAAVDAGNSGIVVVTAKRSEQVRLIPSLSTLVVHDRIDILSGMPETVGWAKTAGMTQNMNTSSDKMAELFSLDAALVLELTVGSDTDGVL